MNDFFFLDIFKNRISMIFVKNAEERIMKMSRTIRHRVFKHDLLHHSFYPTYDDNWVLQFSDNRNIDAMIAEANRDHYGRNYTHWLKKGTKASARNKERHFLHVVKFAKDHDDVTETIPEYHRCDDPWRYD